MQKSIEINEHCLDEILQKNNHVNIDKNAQRSHTDFNEGTQCVTISFTDHSSNKCRHPEDMVYRLQLTYDEIVDILDFKNIPTSTNGYTLVPGIYEVTGINLIILC